MTICSRVFNQQALSRIPAIEQENRINRVLSRVKTTAPLPHRCLKHLTENLTYA